MVKPRIRSSFALTSTFMKPSVSSVAAVRKTLRIGNLALASRFTLAPLAGYTNLPFRLSIRDVDLIPLEYGDMIEVLFAGGPVEGRVLSLDLLQERLKELSTLAPSQFEAGFVSLAHRPREIDATLAAARRAFARLD